MRKTISRILTFLLALTLLCGTAFAAGEIYVNNAQGKLSGSLEDAYAVGRNGNAKIGSSTAYALTAAGLQTIGANGQSGQEPGTMIRVGLFFGSSVKSEAVLDLTNGESFRAGYYDADRNFVEIGQINAPRVNVVPDRNAEIRHGVTGAYHIRLNKNYDSYDAAMADAANNGGFPAYLNGKLAVLIGSYATPDSAQEALNEKGIDATVFSGSNRSVSVLRANTEQVLFLFDCGSTYALTLSPVSAEKAITQCGDYAYYGDFQFARLTGEDLTVVNYIELEDYTKGVLPNEMASDWPLEALKAQAVVARTYALANLNKFRSYGFDLSNDTSSQVYRGLRSATEKTDRAVAETEGEFVRYEGQLCTVYYFAADGGATEDSENVWTESAVPYLRGVVDPYEADIEFYCKSWRLTVPKDDVGDIDVAYTPIGNVLSVTVNGNTYSKDNVRTFLRNLGASYTSRHFTVTESGDNYVIQGGGYGHNLGMSQWGAYSMAEKHNMTYDQIISFYFTGATVG